MYMRAEQLRIRGIENGAVQGLLFDEPTKGTVEHYPGMDEEQKKMAALGSIVALHVLECELEAPREFSKPQEIEASTQLDEPRDLEAPQDLEIPPNIIPGDE
jgi:hypothetical protein